MYVYIYIYIIYRPQVWKYNYIPISGACKLCFLFEHIFPYPFMLTIVLIMCNYANTAISIAIPATSNRGLRIDLSVSNVMMFALNTEQV